MLSQLFLQVVSLEGLFAPPCTALRHDLFSFPLLLPNRPSQSQVAPSGFSSLRHLSAPSENPRRFSVVIPLKSSYRPCFRGLSGWPAPAASDTLPSPSAAGLFIPSPCWRAEKSTIPHLFVNFFRDVFCVRLFPPPLQYSHNLHIMNSICFCHTASFHRIFF